MRRGAILAALLPIAALVSVVPAAADPGELTGEVTAAVGGAPVGGACVTVFDLDLHQVADGCADDAGHFVVPGIAEGVYKVRATAPGYSEMWAYSKGSGLAADVISLPGSLIFALRQGHGTLGGQVTDAGQPAPGAEVSIMDTAQRWRTTVVTDAGGHYVATGLDAGEYQVQVTLGDRSQWAHQKFDVFDAAVFTVADGATTTVDEAMLPYATVRVHVTDAVTGAPVPNACAYLDSAEPNACGGADGVITYTGLPARSSYALDGANDPAGLHWPLDQPQDVDVTPGETTDVTVALRQASAIHTTVQDTQTQAPVKDVCVEEHGVPVVGVLDRDYTSFCSDADGNLVIGPLDPGSYQLLAKPLLRDDGTRDYGIQWVGTNGHGTGDLRLARTVTTTLNEAAIIPAITMDRPGTITGKVTDAASGAGVNLVCAYPYAVDMRIGLAFGPNCSRNGGTYTISGLGPYAWPIEFYDSTRAHATRWSGGAADRFAAAPVQVRAGATVTSNTALVTGGVLSGHMVPEPGGTTFGYMYLYNAKTGDIVQDTNTEFEGTYTAKGLASQQVKINYLMDRDCWHLDAADFAHATPVETTVGTTTSLDVGPCRLP